VKPKHVYIAFGAVTLVLLIVIAYLVIQPSGVLTFHAKDFVKVGNNEEGMILEVEVSSWHPFGLLPRIIALVGDSFWIIDGTKYTYVEATLKVKLTYYGIKVDSLNATIIELWCEYSSTKSYIINADPLNSLNSATEGTYNRYDSNPFQGSKQVSDVASELSLSTSSANTVYYKYQVKFVGTGAKSGTVYSADTGVKNCEPSSGSWEYYTESAGSPTSSGEVSYSSWIDIGAFAGAFLGVFVAFWLIYREKFAKMFRTVGKVIAG